MFVRHEIKSYMANVSYLSFGGKNKFTDNVSGNCSAYGKKLSFCMKHILHLLVKCKQYLVHCRGNSNSQRSR